MRPLAWLRRALGSAAIMALAMLGPADAQGLSHRGETPEIAAPTVSVTRLGPGRFAYRITMTLPTPCHSLSPGKRAEEGDVATMIHSVVTSGDICAQVLTEASVEGELDTGAADKPGRLEVRGSDGAAMLVFDLTWRL